MIDLIIGFVIAGVLFVVEYFLCVKLKNPLWGGIIPMLILIGTIWIFASGKVPLTICDSQYYIFWRLGYWQGEVQKIATGRNG